jgi:uncharacterized membrane protein
VFRFDLDLVLAILHHLFVFALFAVLFAEFVSVRPGMSSAAVARVASIDAWYGALAGLIIIVGFARAIFAALCGAAIRALKFFPAKSPLPGLADGDLLLSKAHHW